MEDLNYPITWDSEHNIGIVEIDAQHRHFVQILNSLFMAWVNVKSRADIMTILDELLDYMSLHFDFEEDLIRTYDVPNLEAHKNIHLACKNVITEMIAEYKSTGSPQELFKLLDYLEDWLITHVRDYDLKYAEYLQKKGVR